MATATENFNYGNFGLPPDGDWVEDTGVWETAWEGTCMSIASTAAQYYWTRFTSTGPATANYEVTAVAQSYGDTAFIGPGARLTSGGNGYAIIVRGGYGAQLVRLDAGVGTVLGTVADTQAVNTYYTIKLSVNGSTIKAYVDGVEKLSVTDSTYSAAGHWGLVAYGGDSGYGSRVDQFDAADLAGAGSLLLLPRRMPLAILAR